MKGKKVLAAAAAMASLAGVAFAAKKPVARPVATASAAMTPIPGFVAIDGGTFTMGRKGGDDDEKTLHKVRLDSFYMGLTEVTQKQWKTLMGKEAGRYDGDDFPVVNVSWFDAVDYCNALSKKEGLTPVYSRDGDNVIWNRSANGYRLPTEAEWEFAARGGIKGKGFRFAGSNDGGEVAWHNGTADGYLRKVGLLKPNELGLFDMSGNACEWCWDWWGKLSYTAAEQTNPTGLSKGTKRMYKGGDVSDPVEKCDVGYRNCYTPTKTAGTIGFRVVRSVGRQLPGYVLVPGGSFKMGGETPDNDANPVHAVSVSPFYIGATEVTQGQFASVMGRNPSYYKGADDLPVEKITWDDAVEYCNALSKRDRLTPCYKKSKSGYICDFSANGWRLPTEAEWEYAARSGGKDGYQYAGSNDSTEVGWVAANSNCPRSVATLRPNGLGLYDMTGNVREWCWDWYDKASYAKHDKSDPRGIPNGTRRVNRGGDWGVDGSADYGFGYVIERFSTKPAECGNDIGLRVVRNAK